MTGTDRSTATSPLPVFVEAVAPVEVVPVASVSDACISEGLLIADVAGLLADTTSVFASSGSAGTGSGGGRRNERTRDGVAVGNDSSRAG